MNNTSIKSGASTEPQLSSYLEAFRPVNDVRISLSAELGRSLVSVEELLRLQVNDVISLTRSTGEHVDLLAEDVLIGNAEIVATDESLSVHVVDLLDNSPV